MISKLSAKYQCCAIRTADTRDGQLTTPGVYTLVVRELSMICPSFVHRLYSPYLITLLTNITRMIVNVSRMFKSKTIGI